MSTKSLDLSLPLQHHHSRNEPGTPIVPKEFKMKIDAQYLQSYEQIGQKLIEDQLVLSALELYAELAEAGYEVLCLKQFFSNPANFEKAARSETSRLLVRSLSQATLDSLDFAPPSEDGDRTGEDKVAVLEFELRKAKETIMALRENLTQQVELENASTRSDTGSSSSHHNHNSRFVPINNTAQISACLPEPIKAYEQRAINFLVHEYLLTHGYRLTSITFADENTEQDFEHWDDVGLNMERPADLLTIFRLVHRIKSTFQQYYPPDTQDIETQTEIYTENDEGDLTMQITSLSTEDIQISNDAAASKSWKTNLVGNTTPACPEDSEHLICSNTEKSTSNEGSNTALSQPPTQLQNTARALKEEFQQGVEDVCQKFNNFFSKSHVQISSTSKSSSLPHAPIGLVSKTSTDKASFTLFQYK